MPRQGHNNLYAIFVVVVVVVVVVIVVVVVVVSSNSLVSYFLDYIHIREDIISLD